MYSDDPWKKDEADALGFASYADALALLMDSRATNTPLTIAVNGPWGSGKTSVANMARASLAIGSDYPRAHVICEFDAWANEDAPHLGGAFAAVVARAVNGERHWWTRLLLPLPSPMLSPEGRWWRRLRLWFLTVALAIGFVYWSTAGAPFASLLHSLLHHPLTKIHALGHGATAVRLAWSPLIMAVIIAARKLDPGVQAVARWISDPRSEAASGSMQEVSDQLGKLIKQALRGTRRLMIFVDNMERCQPPRALEICEVITHLIGHHDVVTVLVGDMHTIALSAESKYATLESVAWEAKPAGAYGHLYLEKLIQIQVRVPPPLPTGLNKMLGPTEGGPPASEDVGGERRRERATKRARQVAILRAQGRWQIAAPLVTIVLLLGLSGADEVLLGASLVGAVITAAAQLFIEDKEDRQNKRRRIEIDDVVGRLVDQEEITLRLEDKVTKAVREHLPEVSEEEVRRRMRQHLISTSDLRRQVDTAVLQMLPSSPRGAKRMVNHAHLLLDIGIQNGIFAGHPRILPRQLAKWVALTERWPLAEAAVTRDLALIGRLEDAARKAGPGLRPGQLAAIENRVGFNGLNTALLDFLRGPEPLGPIAPLLVHFCPVVNSTQRWQWHWIHGSGGILRWKAQSVKGTGNGHRHAGRNPAGFAQRTR